MSLQKSVPTHRLILNKSAICLATLSALSVLTGSAIAADKLVGGENAVSADYVGTTTPQALTVTGSEYDEIIGGHHVKQISNEGASATNLIAVENKASFITVDDIDGVQYIVGGSKSNNSFADLQTGKTTVEIKNGTIGLTQTSNDDLAVVGGNLLKATFNQGGNVANASTEETLVNISGGTFIGADIVAGSKAYAYGTTNEAVNEAVSLNVTDADTKLIVSGGDFSDAGDIVGGSVADGQGAHASVTNSNVEITGGIFRGILRIDEDKDGKEKPVFLRQAVYGGSVALNGATASTETSSLKLVGGENFSLKNVDDITQKGTVYLTLYAGGLNAPTTKQSSLTVEGADLGFVYNGETKTVQLYSGSHYQTAGTYQEGDSVLSVSDSIVRGDIRGTSWVGPTSGNTSGYQVTTGNSTVTVTDTVMNGYTQGVSTWNGRIFGGGILQYTSDSSLTIASTHVSASGITGLDTEQGSGEVTHNPGVRIFGGGQVYDDRSAMNNKLTVQESFVELTGSNSEVLDVVGGSMISGTNSNDSNVVVLGTSQVHVTDATVTGWVLGGNDVNWFGSGRVEGDTTVTVDGSATVGTIIGANTATFWGGYIFGSGVRQASMDGNASITVSGNSSVNLVIGAGYAESSHESGDPSVGDGTTTGRTENDLNSASVSTLTGNTQILVSDSATVGVLAGAGYSWTDASYYIDGELKKTQRGNATMTGTAASTVAGGSVGQWILGGLAEGYGQSNLDGDAAGTLTAGEADMVVVGGLGSEVKVFDLEYSSASKKASIKDNTKTSIGESKISGNATLTATGGKLGTVILGGAVSDLQGTVSTPSTDDASKVEVAGTASLVITGDVDLSGTTVLRGSAAHTQLQFGANDDVWKGTFANFSGIDLLTVAEGSELSLQSLTVAQMGADGITIDGDGRIVLQTLDHASKTVSLSGGTLAVGSLAMSGDGKLTVSNGTLETTSSSIFTTGLSEDGSTLNAGGLSDQTKEHVAFEGGVLALNDKAYNFYYASSAAGLVGSDTEVVFNGTLVSVDQTDTTTGSLTVSDYTNSDSAIAENVVFSNAQLDATQEADGVNLTIGVGTGDDQIVVQQNVGVGSLLLKQEAQKVTINDNKVLTLVGNGADLVSGAAQDVTIEVGSSQEGAGTLRLGTTGSSSSGGKINADVNVLKSGQVVVQSGNFTASGNFENAGEVHVADGASLTLAGLENAGRITIEGTAAVGGLFASESGTGLIFVGTDATAGMLALGGDTLAGNTIFLDPSWKTQGGNVVEEASQLVTTAKTLDGGIIVGRNSFAVVGTSSADEFLGAFNGSGLTWGPEGGVTAAAYLAGQVDVSKGSLVVDGALTEVPTGLVNGTVTFGADSLLVADVSKLNAGNALITGAEGSQVKVDTGARLILSGVIAGTDYQMIANSTATWQVENIMSANAMFGNAQTTETGAVRFELQTAADVYGSLMQGHALVDAALGSDASSAEYMYADALLTQTDGNLAQAARRFDAAMNPAGALSIFTNAMDRAGELREAVRQETLNGTDSRLWARITGGRTKLDGISSGAQSIYTETKAYGLAVGAERKIAEGAFGAAFIAGRGTTDNDAVSGKDDFDYYGFSIYGRMSAMGFDILGDASVTKLDSNLTIGDGVDVNADASTLVWSIGGQLRKAVAFAWGDLTPFAGIDVYHIASDGFSNGHGARIEDSSANAVEFSLGTEYSKTFVSTDGMTVKPQLSLAVVPTLGDADIDSNVAFAGSTSKYNFTFADDVKIRSRLGVSAHKGSFQLGVQAGYDWGNEQRQSFMGQANLKYMF